MNGSTVDHDEAEAGTWHDYNMLLTRLGWRSDR
jgi:hypothetical protein